MCRPSDIYAKAGTAAAVPARPRPLRSGQVLLDLAFEGGLGNVPDDRIHVLPALEEEDAGNGTDVESHRRMGVRVHVDLGDLGPAGVLTRELFQHRSHDQTRPAPRRPEVDQDQPTGLFDLAAERSVGDVDSWAVRRGHGVILLWVETILQFAGGPAWPKDPVSRMSGSPCPTSSRPSHSIVRYWGSSPIRQKRRTVRRSCRCPSVTPRSSCWRPTRPTDPSPNSWPAAAPGSITSATGCPTSMRRSPRAAE